MNNTDIRKLLERFATGDGSVVEADHTAWLVEINGALISLFNDAEKLDYVERISWPDGETLDYDDLAEADSTDAIHLLSNADCAAIEARCKSAYVVGK